MKKLLYVVLSVIVISGLILSGCGEPEPAPETPVPAPTPPSSPTPTATPPETVMTLYENTEHGFSIEYPEAWAEM